MSLNGILSLFDNIVLLMGLFVVYQVVYLLPSRYHRMLPVIQGLLISLICVAIMSMPFKLHSGVVFDTRSILISVTALIFGPILTVVTVVVAALFRMSIGGVGTLPGLAVLLSSALIGLAWRHWLYPKPTKWQWLNIYAMSVCVHISMLLSMFLLPYPESLLVISEIMMPVMLLYPVVTVFLSLMLIRQQTLRHLQHQVKQSEERFQLLFDKAPLGYQSLDFDGNFVEVNQRWCDLLGYSRDEIIGKWFGDYLSPAHRDAFRQRFPLFKSQGHIHSEFEMLHKSGKLLTVSFEGKIGHGADGKFLQTHCILQDVTQQKIVEKDLLESERSKSVLLANLPGMAYRCTYDREWTMQFVSAGCLELTGYPPESLINNRDVSFNQVITSEYREQLWRKWERNLANRKQFRHEYEITTATHDRKWVMELGEGVFGEDGTVEALEGIIIDISERKMLENKLKYNNEHDFWTGLYNLRSFVEVLGHEREHGYGEKAAVVGINLSDIHILGNAYGFRYGQNLIKKVADALKFYCNNNRQLFHIYENQFGFYVKAYKDKDALTEFCNNLIHTLGSVLTGERIGGSIGVVEIQHLDVDQVLRNLMVAFENTNNSENRDFDFCFYDKEMETQLLREQKIERELSHITANANDGRLFLQFQPILDLASHKICGFEALARLDSETYDRVPPLEFIPIAEKTKLIIPLGRLIILQALQFSKSMQEKGYDTIDVAINISAIQLLEKNFAKNFIEMVAAMQVNPAHIEIEITESVFASNFLEINEILADLKASGIKISIDDFGTGYSSLARERELNVNSLKIDRSFIVKLLTLKDEEAITGDIITMAHKMGHCVTAEGVEEERQLQYLKDHGCDKIQGYLIARPLDKEAALGLLLKTNKEKCE